MKEHDPYLFHELYDVEVKAYSEDEEPYRIHRLNRVIGYVHAKDGKLLRKVKSIHDHKGRLTVEWLVKPIDGSHCLFNEAWGDLMVANELETEVEHEII